MAQEIKVVDWCGLSLNRYIRPSYLAPKDEVLGGITAATIGVAEFTYNQGEDGSLTRVPNSMRVANRKPLANSELDELLGETVTRQDGSTASVLDIINEKMDDLARSLASSAEAVAQ